MKTTKTVNFFIILFVMLAVTMTLFTPIPNNFKLIIRIILIVISFITWRSFDKKNYAKAKDLAFTLLALNLAFLIVSFLPGDFWILQMETSKGFALSKLYESLIIIAVVILSFVLYSYTKSIIAPMLILAGADIMIILPVFISYGVTS